MWSGLVTVIDWPIFYVSYFGIIVTKITWRKPLCGGKIYLAHIFISFSQLWQGRHGRVHGMPVAEMPHIVVNEKQRLQPEVGAGIILTGPFAPCELLPPGRIYLFKAWERQNNMTRPLERDLWKTGQKWRCVGTRCGHLAGLWVYSAISIWYFWGFVLFWSFLFLFCFVWKTCPLEKVEYQNHLQLIIVLGLTCDLTHSSVGFMKFFWYVLCVEL